MVMARRGKPASNTIEDKRGIQSVEVGAVILLALSSSDKALTLKEICDQTGMTPSKIHRYLASFIRTGFVKQDIETGKYDLGAQSLDLGLSALGRFNVVEGSTEVLERLTSETGMTTLLSVWSKRGPTIVRTRRATAALITVLSHGVTLPATRSATGQVFIAFLEKSLTRDIIKKELEQNRRNTGLKFGPQSKAELEQIIDSVRRHGAAWVDVSVVPSLKGVAVPILDPDGFANAVIAIVGTDAKLINPGHPNVEKLRRACAELSAYRAR